MIACYVIKTHQRSKPLGMQTLLSRMIVIFVNTLTVSGFNFASTFIAVEQFGPFTEIGSIICTLVPYTSVIAFMLSWLMLTVTKYLSVYDNHWIASLDDNVIARRALIVILIVPPLVTLIEFTFLTKIQVTMGYLSASLGFTHTGAAKREVIMPAMTLLATLLVAILQFRIELDRYRNGEVDGLIQKVLNWICSGSNHDNHEAANAEAVSNASVTLGRHGYSIIVMRAFTVLLVPIFLVLAAGSGGSLKLNIVIGFVIIHAIAPMAVIWNHKGMRGILVTKLSTIMDN